jgi:type II restriction enzyme
MPKVSMIEVRLEEARIALLAMGLPKLTKRAETTRALAVLSCSGLKPASAWKSAQDVISHSLTTRQIITFVNQYYGERIAAGSYDDVRRSWLKDPRNANIVVINKPDSSQNDPTRAWGLSPLAAEVLRQVGTSKWENVLKDWFQSSGHLATEMKQIRNLNRTEVSLPDGSVIQMGPGPHNALIKAINEEFLPRYGYSPLVLYVGDAETRTIIKDEETLKKVGFFELNDGELPDVVAYSPSKNWLYLIEAVTSSGPISYSRREKFKRLLKDCTAELIFVTSFPDKQIMRKHLDDLAWETEVWLSSDPDHLIHLNGDKFLGPYKD